MIYVRKGQQDAAYNGSLSGLQQILSQFIPKNASPEVQ